MPSCRPMNRQHIRALIRLEGRRSGRLLLRLYLVGAGLIVLFAVLGEDLAENVLAVIMGGTMGTTLLIPLTVSRDRLKHTLEFLLSLPATVPTLVVARFAAAAVGLLPGSIATGVAVALLPLPTELGFMDAIPAFALALGFWLLLTVVAWTITAAAAAFDLSTLLGWPLGVFVGLCFVLPWAVRTFGPDDAGQALLSFLEQPFAGAVIVTVAITAMIATAAGAFVLACRGFAGYTPSPDKPL